MSQDASISVIVPCYNYGRFLKDCVESALVQTGVDLRVLILNDASTDHSAQVATQLLAADPRVEYVAHATNQGHIATYNEGVAWAMGSYTVLIDADDILTKGSLQRSCDLLDAHPELAFVYGRAHRFGGDCPAQNVSITPPKWSIWQGREWFEDRCSTTENCVLQPTVVMRTSVLKKAGNFRPELPHAADMEMWMRLALHADVGYINEPDQAFYRLHSANMHRQFGSELTNLTQIRGAFSAIFGDEGLTIPNRNWLEQSVKRKLATRALLAACGEYDRGRVSQVDVAGLEELAISTCDDFRELREWQRLRWRKKIGPIATFALQRFISAFKRVTRSLRKLKNRR